MRSEFVFGTVALSAAVVLAGCFGHASGYAEVDTPVVFAEEPTLVVVEPGVWVVRDYDYAVYYVDDYYWVYRDDVWHRSRTYDGGWARVEVNVVPRVIVSRDHRTYVHYRGAPNAPTRKAPRRESDDRAAPGRGNDDHTPPGHANDEHGPPGHGNDDHTPPGHANDEHGPPGHGNDDHTPPGHADDEHGPPGHADDQRERGRDDEKPNAHDKKDDKRGNDKGKPDKDDHKQHDDEGRHDKK